MVTDFSGEDKANSVCTVVYGHHGHGISHFGELCTPRSPKSDESASAHRHRTIHVTCAIREIARRVNVGSACVDIRPSPKTDVAYLFD